MSRIYEEYDHGALSEWPVDLSELETSDGMEMHILQHLDRTGKVSMEDLSHTLYMIMDRKFLRPRCTVDRKLPKEAVGILYVRYMYREKLMYCEAGKLRENFKHIVIPLLDSTLSPIEAWISWVQRMNCSYPASFQHLENGTMLVRRKKEELKYPRRVKMWRGEKGRKKRSKRAKRDKGTKREKKDTETRRDKRSKKRNGIFISYELLIIILMIVIVFLLAILLALLYKKG